MLPFPSLLPQKLNGSLTPRLSPDLALLRDIQLPIGPLRAISLTTSTLITTRILLESVVTTVDMVEATVEATVDTVEVMDPAVAAALAMEAKVDMAARVDTVATMVMEDMVVAAAIAPRVLTNLMVTPMSTMIFLQLTKPISRAAIRVLTTLGPHHHLTLLTLLMPLATRPTSLLTRATHPTLMVPSLQSIKIPNPATPRALTLTHGVPPLPLHLTSHTILLTATNNKLMFQLNT